MLCLHRLNHITKQGHWRWRRVKFHNVLHLPDKPATSANLARYFVTYLRANRILRQSVDYAIHDKVLHLLFTSHPRHMFTAVRYIILSLTDQMHSSSLEEHQRSYVMLKNKHSASRGTYRSPQFSKMFSAEYILSLIHI